MARYIGPKTKICRIYGEPILGNGKWLTKNSNPPGQHGATRKRKTLGEYALQLREKQKAKYTYGLLERQFRKTFEEASRMKGVKGENLIKLLEANGDVMNVPTYSCKPGDIIGYKNKRLANDSILTKKKGKNPKFSWVDWNDAEQKGVFITYPERESVPENIKEQLIVELYSK